MHAQLPPPSVPTWTAKDGNWTDAGNWNTSVPNAVDASATFLNGSSGSYTVTLGNAPITLGNLNFQTGSNSFYTPTFVAGTLVFESSSGLATVTSEQDNNGNQFDSTLTVQLKSNTKFRLVDGAFSTVQGTVSGDGQLSVQGDNPALLYAKTGGLRLFGANTYKGGTLVANAYVEISGDENLGDASGGLTLDGGALSVYPQDKITKLAPTDIPVTTINRATVLGDNGGALFFSGNYKNSFFNVPVLEWQGNISGNGAFTVYSEFGAIALKGNNTYTGTTTVGFGILRAGAENTFSPTSAVVIAGQNLLRQSIVGPSLLNNLFYGSLDLNGFHQQIGSLSGYGAVFNGLQIINLPTDITPTDSAPAQPTLLTVGGNNTDTGYAGLIVDSVLVDYQNETVTNDPTHPLALVKVGSGTLALFGENLYSGGTTIKAGTLAIVDSTNLGDSTSMLTFDGGTLLTGLPIYSQTAIEPLINRNGFSYDITLNQPITIAAGGATVDVSTNFLQYPDFIGPIGNAAPIIPSPGQLTLTGNITGEGSLTKKGSGNLVLAGSSSYTGATVVQAGSLAGGKENAFSAASTHTVEANAVLDLGGFNQTVGSLAGAGVVTNGQIFSVQPNSQAISRGSEPLAVSKPATLTVGANNQSTVFSGVLQDGVSTQFVPVNVESAPIPVVNVLSLTKVGTGTLNLTGANTYTGDTSIEAGTLLVNGSLKSPTVTVAAGGTLGGSGLIYGNVVSAGTTSPGNSPGTLTINGNYTQTPGSVLVIQLASSTVYDHVIVNGTAVLAGTLKLQALDFFLPKRGKKYTYVTATEGITGTFSQVTTDFGAAVSYEYDAQNGAFFIPENAFRFLGKTPNQIAVARNLDNIANAGLEPQLIGKLNTYSQDQLLQAFDQISPEQLGALSTLSFSYANNQVANLERRLFEARQGVGGVSTSGLALINAGPALQGGGESYGKDASWRQSKKLKNLLKEDPKLSFFATGAGTFGEVGNSSNAVGYDFTTGGITAGADYRVAPNAVVGAYVGYANSNSDSRRGAGKVDLNSGKFGVYGTVFDKGFYVNGALQGGYNSYDTRRSVLGQNAISSPEGEEFTGYLGTGYEARFKNFSFGPIASLQVNYVGVDQFTETGSASPLTVTNMDKYSVRSHFGAQANYAVKVLGLALTPHVSAQWQHEFLDTETAIDSRFASGSGGLFTVYSVETGADTALLGAGLDVQITPAVGTYVDYDGEVGASRYEAHSVNGGVRIKF